MPPLGADGGEAEAVEDEGDIFGDGDAADEGVIEIVAAVPRRGCCSELRCQMKTGRISVKGGIHEEERIGDRGGENVEGVIALKHLAAGAGLERARGVAGDVVPAPLEPIAGACPEAAEIGIAIDDAGL